VLVITATLMVVEFIGGLMSGSLTLLADAGHMLSDVGALGLALFAAWMADRPSPPRRTFGAERAEILAAFVNAVLLSVVMVSVVREAIVRLRAPVPPDIGPMFAIGALGLLGNVAGLWILRGVGHGNLNMRAAYLEVVADLLASIAVLAAAALTHFGGWVHADPVLSLGLALFIAPRIVHLLREAIDILMENAPRGLDVEAVRSAIANVPDVIAVHDLHIWAITPSRVCLSAHVVGRDGADRDSLLGAISRTLRDGFGIGHTTLQVEGDSAAADLVPGCDACEPTPARTAGSAVTTPATAEGPTSGAHPTSTAARAATPRRRT
jgi:cobalt-zinc-cadmium efflux system protein